VGPIITPAPLSPEEEIFGEDESTNRFHFAALGHCKTLFFESNERQREGTGAEIATEIRVSLRNTTVSARIRFRQQSLHMHVL
jgi:hypothetical protein